MSDINKFETHNSSISVNVFGIRKSTVNLLLISDNTKQHYYWINDISKLLSLQTSKHGHARHVCFRCLNTFNSNDEYCKSYEAIKIELPEERSKISFKNHNRSMRVPFIIYADFESFTPHCHHANQTLTRATPSTIRNTSLADFDTT